MIQALSSYYYDNNNYVDQPAAFLADMECSIYQGVHHRISHSKEKYPNVVLLQKKHAIILTFLPRK